MIPPRILIIAGSDSGGGAGIQADIKTVAMMGGHPMTAITALTAQNTMAVEAVMAVPAEMVLMQIDAVAGDIGIDAVKIGMIGWAETVEAVAARLERLRAEPPAAREDPQGGYAEADGALPIVFDPVMVASSGAALADEATIRAFGRLMTVATLVTPNAPELAALTGRAVETLADLEDAALALAKRSGVAVLAKGGHIPGNVVTDVLVLRGGEVHRWEAARIETLHTHGTGCTLASGIACGLGQGRGLVDSVSRARDFVQEAIRAAPGFGKGHGPMGHALGTVPFDLVHKKLS